MPDSYRPDHFIHRDLSLLAFHERVLEEARRHRHPLLERVKFLGIFYSNMEEFFMVRVAGRMQQVAEDVQDVGPDGLTPAQVLARIQSEARRLYTEAEAYWDEVLHPELEASGVSVVPYSGLDGRQREALDREFQDLIFPVLTPLAFDPARPFPHIVNQSLNLAVLLRDPAGKERFGWVRVPESLPQLLPVPGPDPELHEFVWIEDLIAGHLHRLFPGSEILDSHPFQVTRDADMAIQEWEAVDLLKTIEDGVRKRRFGAVVKLAVGVGMPARVLEILMAQLSVEPKSVYHKTAPLIKRRLLHLHGVDAPELKDPRWPVYPSPGLARSAKNGNLFAQIRSHDILMHHPFEPFDPVVNLLEQAASDPAVMAIRTTLYRVGRHSPVVQALLNAADRGKQVTAVVELRARFDEESNIEWARALESKGVNVVYGQMGLKVHAKAAMVVRREDGRIRRYVHLSTGNYNFATSQVYTDLGLFTASDEIGADTTELFNSLTGYSAGQKYSKLLVGPGNLRSGIEDMIRRETRHAAEGRGGRLIFKTNALVDKGIIELLYDASQAGVEIDLLVRGMCCLRPGVPGLSDNIRVRSIVGRFLEHGRVYYFGNGGQEQVFLGSADLMPRNLNWRVEVVFPVEHADGVRFVRDNLLKTYLKDEVNTWTLDAAGTYSHLSKTSPNGAFDAHLHFLENPRAGVAATRLDRDQ